MPEPDDYSKISSPEIQKWWGPWLEKGGFESEEWEDPMNTLKPEAAYAVRDLMYKYAKAAGLDLGRVARLTSGWRGPTDPVQKGTPQVTPTATATPTATPDIPIGPQGHENLIERLKERAKAYEELNQ